ncbi:MAG: hypothetical protein ACT4O5_09925 [Gammaproteobacteria bacterium]
MYARLGVLIGVALAAQQAVAVDGPPTLFQDVTLVVLPEGRLDAHRDVLVRTGSRRYAACPAMRGTSSCATGSTGEALGPRLYTAGPSLNGNSAPPVERAVAMVREQAAAGFDFLKLHPGLKRSDDVGVVHASWTATRHAPW